MDENEERNFNRHFSNMESAEVRRQYIAKSSILVVLTLERLAYYGLLSSFFLFLNEGPWDIGQSWDSVEALNAVYFLTGISYLSALLGGYISDAFLGRFRAIAFGFVLYLIGYILLTLIAVDKLPRLLCLDSVTCVESKSDGVCSLSPHKPLSPCKSIIYISSTILGIGSGVVKSNIAPFGAEQLRSSDRRELRSFFNWFYWCVNIGSMVGIGAIAYIEQDNPGICKNGFFCGYFIASVCILLALVIFLCLSPWFLVSPPEGSLLLDIARIFFEALRANFRHWRYRRRNPNLSPLHVDPAFLDRAKIRYGGTFHEGAVDDVSALGKLMAVFAVLIPYWIVAFQMETSFQVQGLHMRFGGFLNSSENDQFAIEEGQKFAVPAAWLTLFNQIFLIVSIPLFTTFLYPRLDRAGVHLSIFVRICLGMVFSCLAVLIAGGLESYRTYLWRNVPSSHIDLRIGNVKYHAVDISIFWQVPQYVMVGAAEVFANIAGLEFAYTASPVTFQGLIMGLYYSTEGLASFLGILVLRLVSPFWFSKTADSSNINDNHLDFYLYFLALIQFTTLVSFAMVLYIRRFTLRLVVMPMEHSREHSSGTRGGPSGRGNERNAQFEAPPTDTAEPNDVIVPGDVGEVSPSSSDLGAQGVSSDRQPLML